MTRTLEGFETESETTRLPPRCLETAMFSIHHTKTSLPHMKHLPVLPVLRNIRNITIKDNIICIVHMEQNPSHSSLRVSADSACMSWPSCFILAKRKDRHQAFSNNCQCTSDACVVFCIYTQLGYHLWGWRWRRIAMTHCLTTHCRLTTHHEDAFRDDAVFRDDTLPPDNALWLPDADDTLKKTWRHNTCDDTLPPDDQLRWHTHGTDDALPPDDALRRRIYWRRLPLHCDNTCPHATVLVRTYNPLMSQSWRHSLVPHYTVTTKYPHSLMHVIPWRGVTLWRSNVTAHYSQKVS